jgi:hypothetical protein
VRLRLAVSSSNTEELEQFLKGLKMKKPKVQFVARNAPFMRRAPIPTG